MLPRMKFKVKDHVFFLQLLQQTFFIKEKEETVETVAVK